MLTSRWLAPALVLAAALGLLTAAPARAQYMFLDANGDGVNTAADVIAPSGTTTLEIWLKTDTNRDGSAAVCSTGEDLNILSYEFILHAENGKVTWGAYTNLQSTMGTSFGLKSSDTEYHNGFGGPTILSPGTYHLGTLPVNPALGTPSITIASSASLGGAYTTSFGSQCSGVDFDNTLKLGTDWFDADGVAYGGTSQSPPVLAAIADMALDEGATATQTLTATDADGQPLEFSKVSGPSFMAVTTTDPGVGTASGAVTLAPSAGNNGTSTGTVRVTDGIAGDQRSFGITVNDVNTGGPVIAASPTIPASLYVQSSGNVFASDPDGDLVTLRMVGGPSYLIPYLFGTTEGAPNVGGTFHFAPAATDVGTQIVSFEATDGITLARGRSRIVVTGPTPPPPPPADLFQAPYTVTETGGPPSGIGMGDLDRDGDDDAAIASAAGGVVEIYASDRRGGLDRIEQIQAAAPVAIAVGDLDQDGAADVVYVDDVSGDLFVHRGPFAGSTPMAQQFHLGSHPVAIRLGDLDQDGRLDALVVLRGSDGLAVLRSDGQGSLLAPTVLATSADPVGVTIGDFNADSRPDVAVVTRSSKRLDVFLGTAQGDLAPPVSQGFPTLLPDAFPTGVATYRVNSDERDDLAVGLQGPIFASILVIPSMGDGTFGSSASSYLSSADALISADLNGDGKLDLLAGIHPTQSNFINEHMVQLAVVGAGEGELARQFYPQYGSPLTGIAVGDVDADGIRDVIATQQWDAVGIGVAAVRRGQPDHTLGAGKVLRQLVAYGGRPLLADFNNDGHLDIVLGNVTVLGAGDGTFGQPIYSDGPSSHGDYAVGDLNGDGRLDVVYDSNRYDIHIRIGNGDGTFVPGPQPVLRSNKDQNRHLHLADLNEDGKLDLLVEGGTNRPVPEYEVWSGRGDGTFDAPTYVPIADFPWSSKLLDYDGDGHVDIVYNMFDAVRAMRGHGDGTFDDGVHLAGFTRGAESFDFGDLNGDGRPDLVTSSQGAAPLRAALQMGDHTFQPGNPFWSLSGFRKADFEHFPMFDINGDGRTDILAGFRNGVAFGLGTGTTIVSKRRLIGPAGGRFAVGDINEDGWLDFIVGGDDSSYPEDLVYPVVVFLNNSEVLNRRAARGFLASGGSKTIPVGNNGRELCVQVEPVGGSYLNTDLDPASIVMKSKGTGSVAQIVAIPSKRTVLGDADGNGIEEIRACFASSDLGKLFSLLKGRQDVPVAIEGRLPSGARMHAEMTLKIVHTGSATAPTLAPNPLNPAGVFRFATTRPGSVRIQLFDVQGRLVRTLVDRPLPAGNQEITFDGKGRDGRSLSSGIYFARIETVEGRYRMRVAIVK